MAVAHNLLTFMVRTHYDWLILLTNTSSKQLVNLCFYAADCAHWEESTLSLELMTKWLNQKNYLCKISIGGLADLGYQVDYNMADIFSPLINNQTVEGESDTRKRTAFPPIDWERIGRAKVLDTTYRTGWEESRVMPWGGDKQVLLTFRLAFNPGVKSRFARDRGLRRMYKFRVCDRAGMMLIFLLI